MRNLTGSAARSPLAGLARPRGRDPVAAGQRGRRQLVGHLLDRQQLRDPARAHDPLRREELLAGRGEHSRGHHSRRRACGSPSGDAHTGSQYVIDFYNGTDPGPGALFDGQHAFQEAKQLVDQNPIPPGTWYYLPVNQNDTQAQAQECLKQPLYFWDPPGTPLPGIQVPPRTLAQLALAKMNIPEAGRMVLSPRTGNSYSNLPTFVRTTLSFRPEFGPGGMPYVTDNAQLGDQAATVWVRATPLQLSTSDNTAQLDTAGCGYLGSTEMVRDPGPVAHTGANGTADCGVTFRQPGTWNITATLTWQACWAVGVDNGPPPADCNPVPGAALNPVNWARNVNVREIQASNGGG